MAKCLTCLLSKLSSTLLKYNQTVHAPALEQLSSGLPNEDLTNDLFSFTETDLPKGLRIVCGQCDTEIKHFSGQFQSYYCSNCLIFYPSHNFNRSTQKGSTELDVWVESMRPIIPVDKPKTKKLKKKDKEAVADKYEEIFETLDEDLGLGIDDDDDVWQE